MYEITTVDLRTAQTVVQYALKQEVESVAIGGKCDTNECTVYIECTQLQYERIFGFSEVLELLQ